MSATSQPTDFSDLFTDLQNRVHVITGVTATANQAKRYINIALHDMHLGFGEKFYWAEREAQLITHAEYTTGTVAVTIGSTTITGTSTAWNSPTASTSHPMERSSSASSTNTASAASTRTASSSR